MASISSLGVGSGLDLQALVDGLIAGEQQRKFTGLNRREAIANERISAFGLLKSSVSLFNDSLLSLGNVSTFQGRNAASSDADSFSVSAAGNAATGSYSVEVVATGQAQRLTGGSFVDVTNTAIASADTAIGGGTLTIQQGGQPSFAVTINSATSSLNEIVAAINSAEGNTGVEASIINADSGPVLVINANDVGTDNQVTIAVDDVDTNNTDAQGLSQLSFDPSDIPGSNLTQANAALDAQITVNGQTVTSNSGNVFSDVISNVSITALAETTSAGTVTITKDIDQATSAVSDFVDSFNALTTSVKDLGRAGNEDGATGGILVGNSVLRSLSGQLRSVIFNVIDETQPEGLRTLSDIGINIDREGQLALDSSKLASLLETNFDDVARLLAADGNAIAQNQQLQSLSFDTVSSELGEGDLTISVGDTSFTVAISAGAANNTLQGVRDAINAAGDNAGVTASIILVDDGLGGTNAQLILTADEVGDESAIAVTVVDGSDADNEDLFGLSRLASVNLTENVASTLDAPSGIVLRLQDVVAGFLGGGGEVGIIDSRTQGLTRDIDRIDDERLLEQNRLNAFQDRLTRQFAGLDLLVANLTASGDFLLSQLSSISEISNSRNRN